jgi:SAM-dependent methyltransferase
MLRRLWPAQSSGAESLWQRLSSGPNWRDYILPRRSDFLFDLEGFIEAQRLFYLIGAGDTVIDYGCGIGRVAKYVAERAREVIGLDISPRFVSLARRQVLRPNATFHVASRFRAREVADFTYSLMVVQHNEAPDRLRIMRHIADLTKPGGTVLVQFPRSESTYYAESNFVHKFRREEVVELAEGFRDVRIVEGNLANYERPFDVSMSHEYFLIARK